MAGEQDNRPAIMKVLADISDDELAAVIAAEAFSRALGRLGAIGSGTRGRQVTSVCIDRYLGALLDRIDKLGLRLRVKV